MRSVDLRRSIVRLRVAGAVLVMVFVLLGARAVQLAVLDTRGAERGLAQTGTVLRLAPARGQIADRNGTELAVTISVPSVYAVPRSIEDVDAAARALAQILGGRPDHIRARLERTSSFVFVDRWVEQTQAEAVEALGLAGLGIVHEPRRAYPHRGLAAQLLGFANIDGKGVRGVEQQEDGWLRGKTQRIALERDARGRLLAAAGHDPRIAAGGDIVLTLDAALQAEAEDALDDMVAKTGALGGLVVAMDPDSGDLLAVAERPGFDPNNFRKTPYAATRSRIFLDASEPGSSLKPFVVALGLESGAISTDELVFCEEGQFRVPGKTIRDTHEHGWLDPAGVLRVSSNIGAAKIGFALGAEPHHAGLRAFGFGLPTNSGFPDESSGLLRDWRQWRTLDHATISFGQGINVTAIQMTAAVSALANGGILHPPRLVAARRQLGGNWRSHPAKPARRAVRTDVADAVRSMLEGVVAGEDGTGSYAALEGVSVAGKTGTAQKLDAETGAYSSSRYLAWFAGMAPADDPELVVVVMIDEPKGFLHSGGATAAPVFARVAASHLASRGVITKPRKDPHPLILADWKKKREQERKRRRIAKAKASADPPARSPQVSKPPRLAEPARRVLPRVGRLGNRVLIPDFRGLTHREVRTVGAGLPIEIELLGAGRAVAQNPAPGTIVAAGGPRVSVRFEARGGGG